MKLRNIYLAFLAIIILASCQFDIFSKYDYLNVPCFTVSNGEVYVAAIHVTDSPGMYNYNYRPWYWKNTERINLPFPNWVSKNIYKPSLSMSGIAVENGDIYTAGTWNNGRDDEKPFYWKNTEIIELPIPKNTLMYTNSRVKNIIVKNGVVYNAGIYCYEIDKVWHDIPCCWKDTERLDLPLPSTSDILINLAGIIVENGEVYISGSYGRYSNYKACYWKGTERIDLPLPANAGNFDLSDIAVKNGNVHIIGSCYGKRDITCYWKNTERIDLPLPENIKSIKLTNITLENDDVYIAGVCTDNRGYIAEVCYWKNMEKISLPLSVTHSPESESVRTLRLSPPPLPSFDISGIAVENGDVHIVGVYNGYNGYREAYYWKNAERIELPLPSNSNSISLIGIIIENGEVYIAGSYYGKTGSNDSKIACYWKGTERTDLPR